MPKTAARTPAPSWVRERLLLWYRASHRDLPWRRTRDPYRVLLSETMCQQTRVEAVIPFYERFLARWPTLADLARASEDDLLRAWAGLGYYSRARNLHAAVRACVSEHGGRLPTTVAALRELPGVGPYTSGAIAAIAFGRSAAAVDGNVVRVLARLHAIDAEEPRARVGELATALAPPEAMGAPELTSHEPNDPGDLVEALMELGATVCVPRAPRCERCPLAERCRGRALGIAASLPRKRPKKAPREEHVAAALVRRASDGAVLLVQRPRKGLLAGMWALPSVEDAPPAPALAAKALEGRFPGLRVRSPLSPAHEWGHQFTHRTWSVMAFEADVDGARTKAEPTSLGGLAARYARGAELEELPTAFRAEVWAER